MTSINEDISTEAKVLAVDESQRVKNGNVNVDDMKMDTDNPPHTSQPQPEVVEDDDEGNWEVYMPEDKYKPEGVVYLKIDNFSEFVRSANSTGGAGENPQRLSEPVYIRGLPWKILAISREMPIRAPPNRRPTGADDFSSRTLGFFLQCNGEATDLTWTCQAVAQLAIVAQREGFQDNSRKISHIYHAKENDWGYSQFAVCDTLANPENGFCVDDTIILRANVSADAPHGVHWDSKKHTGHIGLKNQGATCYMNSILQTLFFINKLRKAVYRMPTEDDDPELSVALSMQRVFYELQFSDQPVGTKKLTKSFGWDSVDSFLQHDVQELCRVLLDNLESKMKNTVVDGTIPALFAGKMKSYIKCKDVEFESSREESFYDVQLNVKGIANVTESFRDYTSPEILDGDNKYDAGDHGMQRAEKGVKFMSFPPVLTLQLMRFQYDVLVDTNTKINDRFEFPEELNLDEFIDADGIPNDYTYVLHAVLVHSGDFHGGHYVVFVNTNSNGKKHRWCKFDDDVVSRAAPRDVIYANYGGDDPDVMCCRAYSSAYMLVYVRKNVMDDVLCDVSTVDIPEHLKIRFENERKREMQRKREKEEASHFCELTILLDDDLKRHTGFDLFDARELEKNPRRTKVEKRMTASQLYETIADICQLDISGFRVWCCGDFLSNAKCSYNMKRDNYPHELIRPKYFLKNDTTEAVFNSDVGDTDQVVYVEMAKRRSPQSNALELLPLDPQNYIAFLKFYDAERDVVEYKGSLILESGKDLASHLPQILALLELPVDTALNVLSELRPDIIFPCRMKTLVRDESRFGDGCILIAEETNKSDSERGAIAYFKNLFNNIEVEAIANQDGFGPTVSGTGEIYPPVRGHIGLDWNLKRVAEWVGKAIDYDSSRILLWKVSQHNDKPTNYVLENGMLARDLLSLTNHNCYDPRVGRLYKVYYTKMPVPVAELEQRRPTRILTVYDKFQTAEMSIFPPRNGTVQDLLNEAARDFRFSENGTKELRLVHASTTANCIRVFQIFPKESLLCEIMNRYVNSFIQLRVEEVPRDQLEIGPDEHLMPVAHFDKEPSRMFGVPFFIKVTDGEKISNVRNRIKELLEVPDREFEKYKFCIVMGARILRELDTDDQTCVVNLSEMLATHITSVAAAPYLGIDHMNKSRGARGGHATEKAIVIHN